MEYQGTYDAHVGMNLVQLTDTEGRLLLMPEAVVDHFLGRGQPSVTLTVNLTGPQPSSQPARWLTVTAAARLYITDVDGITLERAKAKVSRACDAGVIVSKGRGMSRRINPVSLDAWRLSERERDLSQVE